MNNIKAEDDAIYIKYNRIRICNADRMVNYGLICKWKRLVMMASVGSW